jgi:uncharacterized membrane protein
MEQYVVGVLLIGLGFYALLNKDVREAVMAAAGFAVKLVTIILVIMLILYLIKPGG